MKSYLYRTKVLEIYERERLAIGPVSETRELAAGKKEETQ